MYDAQSIMVITTVALALYNACQLSALIFTTFKHYSGLYFWSLLISTLGIIPYTLGWLLDLFDLIPSAAGMAICTVGWILLISGQSFVLYSRLHLVLNNVNIHRAVLWMIIVNGLVWHTTVPVLLFTSGSRWSTTRTHNTPLFTAMEKTQMTFFCLQEFIISGLYLWSTIDILQSSFGSRRKILWHLLSTNLLIVAMDVALLVFIYMDHYTLEQGVKLVTYSLKLKVEFAVLGKLVEFVQHRGGSDPSGTLQGQKGGFIELSERGEAKSKGMPETTYPEGVANQIRVDEQIVVTTRTNIERRADNGESTDGLYNAAVKQVSSG
ncbi:hypothetical protein FOC1_g10000526 [Fusarium oxysporum f. sp. cubense race 1]|uniref:DUF7703 domain-containing protein n=1 Tax=Fusarium oxysporum f. sp. cubense (strain race 1) TaxID=1229664 RepID=N4UEN8_FUSC1|nr:hypothetical protein FOC1_g10000526 [Fusarium oxysporum f. sp. cubense race 1]